MKYFLLLCFLFGIMSFKKKDRIIVLTTFTKQIDPLHKTGLSGIPAENQSGSVGIYPAVVRLREEWKDTRLYIKDIDPPQSFYQAYRTGIITKEVCMKRFKDWGKDTSDCSPVIVRGYVAILEGRGKDGQLYLAADNNGNMDFTDDIPYLVSEKSQPMCLIFERILGERPSLDSAWILPKKLAGYDNYIFWEERDMMTARFTLDKQDYVCNLRPGGDKYDQQSCEVEILASDTVVRGQLHEYLKLGGSYYQIDSIRVDGRYLCLRKEVHPENIRSTQIGFPPLPFVATTIDGQVVHFPDDFKGKYVLLDFWSTGCGPCIQEIKNTYPDLYARYKEKGFEILGIADDWKKDIVRFQEKVSLPWPVIADYEMQGQLHKLYNISSWPTLFLIAPDGKIIARGHDLRDRRLIERLRKIFE